METYPIDLEPEQIVLWVMAESRTRPAEFKITATRVIEAREDAPQVAPGKEDRARTARAAQAILFAMMRSGRIDDLPLAGAADRYGRLVKGELDLKTSVGQALLGTVILRQAPI